MNIVDLIAVLLTLIAVARGIMRGASVQVLSFIGAWGGLAAGALAAPSGLKLFPGEVNKTLAAAILIFGSALVLGAIGAAAGRRASALLRAARLGPVDATAGAAVSVVATLVSIWLITSMLATVSVPEISGPIHQSKIVKALEQRLPPAPSVYSRIGRLLNNAGFPDVFAELEPPPPSRPRLQFDPTIRRAVASARASTVKIVSQGCGGIQSGSGFVGAPGIVMTNAHVIAGTHTWFVYDQRGRHRAEAIYFDPRFDLAMLKATGLAGPPLRLATTPVAPGVQAAVLGFPAGGSFQAKPAAVLREFNAVGRDIYSEDVTSRAVYQLQADVQPGNSGGPVVQGDAQVIGVVFSASAFREQIGYSLPSYEVARRLQDAKRRPSPVSTQRCSVH